jgi:hypothetical protein
MKKLLRITAFILLLPLMTACYSDPTVLSVHTDYLSHETLASYHVNTPDPRLSNPSIGQRLIISWSFPKEYLNLENLRLKVTMRFRTREEVVETVQIHKKSGTYVYNLLNDDYINTRGILTYKVDLIGGDCILEEWRHQIWTDLIVLEKKPCPEKTEDEDEEDNDDDDLDF